MRLRELLQILYGIHKSQPKISMPFICGGIPRDKLIGSAKSKYDDLDITTGDASIQFLAEEFSVLIGRQFEIEKKVAKDGHISVKLSNLKVDFSSNFIVPDIDKLLFNKNIKNPTSLQKEMFSRDFTCNSLLLNLNLKDITDPTNQGFDDINNKIIKTCLDPQSTFLHNLQRIPRVFYIAAKLDFTVDEDILSWIKQNKNLLSKVDDKYISEKISKAIEFNKEKTIDLLNKTDLWNYVSSIQNLRT